MQLPGDKEENNAETGENGITCMVEGNMSAGNMLGSVQLTVRNLVGWQQ